jgi:integrase
MRFTDSAIRRFKAPKQRRIITETGVGPDLRGLQLWLYPTGQRSFFFRYKTSGKSRSIRLGNYPDVKLADAHAQVQTYRGLLREQIDPAEHEAEQREAAERARIETRKAAQRGCTIEELYRDFRDHHLRRERRRPEQAEQAIENHVLPYQPTDANGDPDGPAWRDYKAADLTRREIIARLREINEAGSPRMCEVVKALISQMYRHGLDNGLLDSNPADRLPTIGSRGNPRDRRLTDAEIRKFWDKLDTAKLRPMMRDAYRLLLITGQRRGEVAGARWDEIDGDLWTLPAQRTKNARAHEVPLTDFALEIIDNLDRESDWLFPSPMVRDEPIKAAALSRGLRNNLERFKLPAFSPHDLRRTVYSGMRALGVPPLHVERVFNHSDSGMARHYDAHEYRDEKRDALQLWADHLRAVLAGEKPKVVPIRAAQ